MRAPPFAGGCLASFRARWGYFFRLFPTTVRAQIAAHRAQTMARRDFIRQASWQVPAIDHERENPNGRVW